MSKENDENMHDLNGNYNKTESTFREKLQN